MLGHLCMVAYGQMEPKTATRMGDNNKATEYRPPWLPHGSLSSPLLPFLSIFSAHNTPLEQRHQRRQPCIRSCHIARLFSSREVPCFIACRNNKSRNGTRLNVCSKRNIGEWQCKNITTAPYCFCKSGIVSKFRHSKAKI